MNILNLKIIQFLILVPYSMTEDYCSICADHTMCLYKDTDVAPCSRYRFTASEQDQILKSHNTERSNTALGNNGLPQAANMMRLYWDSELEDVAMRWAIQCQDGHDTCRDVSRFKVGQNMAGNSEWDLDGMMQMWYDEKKDVSAGIVDNFQMGSYGHFTQVVWANTRKIGCAATDQGSGMRYHVFCNYGPAGNVLSEPMYKRGPPQSQCPDGSWKDKEFAGLCARAAAKHISPMMLVLQWIINSKIVS